MCLPNRLNNPCVCVCVCVCVCTCVYLWVSVQLVQCPGQHGGAGLVARDQHRHQVVTELHTHTHTRVRQHWASGACRS